MEETALEDTGNVIFDKYIEEGTLQQNQVTAIKLLSVGYTQKETASELGLDESTISKWKNNNPHFRRARAEYENEIRGEELRSVNNAAVMTALHNLTTAVELDDDPTNGEVDHSLELLKAVGLYGNTLDIEQQRTNEVVCQNDAEEFLIQKFREFNSSPIVAQGFCEFLKHLSNEKIEEISHKLNGGGDKVIDVSVS